MQAIAGRQHALPARGYANLYHRSVLEADEGVDFDFLQSEELGAP
jgi:dihydroxy-acid dehydratase